MPCVQKAMRRGRVRVKWRMKQWREAWEVPLRGERGSFSTVLSMHYLSLPAFYRSCCRVRTLPQKLLRNNESKLIPWNIDQRTDSHVAVEWQEFFWNALLRMWHTHRLNANKQTFFKTMRKKIAPLISLKKYLFGILPQNNWYNSLKL